MELDDLRGLISGDAYADLRRRVWQKAGDRNDVESLELVHDLATHVWKAVVSPLEQVQLTFALYRDLPDYAVLMYLKNHFLDLPEPARAAVLHEFRHILANPDDQLSAATEYALYVDFFEDPRTVADVWRGLIAPPGNRLRTQRVLSNSCAVPWNLKAPAYREALSDPGMHLSIFAGLLGSAQGVYGDIDLVQAHQIFVELKLRPDTRELEYLQRMFGLYEAP